MADDVQVSDNWDRSRYEILFDGRLAGFSTYRRHDGVLAIKHTEIEPEFEGHGLGSRLAEGLLDDIRARGLHVKAECPFVAKYIREHPEYADLVAEIAP